MVAPRVAAPVLLAIGLIAAAAASRAHAEVHVQPSFTVVEIKGGDGDDRISIRCDRDRLYVNGEKAVGGRLHCSALRRLEVFGLRGDDQITYTAEPAGLFAEFLGSGVEPQINVGRGDDRVIVRGVGAAVAAGPGNDVIKATSGLNFIDAGSGRDKVFGGGSIDLILGGSGNDRAEGRAFVDLLAGARGNDRLLGGAGPDALSGTHGRDFLRGLGAGDLLLGGRGPDRAFGGPGRDKVFGGSGRDQVGGGPGKDKVSQGGRRGGGGLLDLFLDVLARQRPASASALRRAVPEVREALR